MKIFSWIGHQQEFLAFFSEAPYNSIGASLTLIVTFFFNRVPTELWEGKKVEARRNAATTIIRKQSNKPYK